MGKNGEYNYSKDAHLYPPFSYIPSLAKNYKITPAMTAKATGFYAAYAITLVRKYRQGGLETIAGTHYGGNRRNISVEKEAEILAPFKERAEKGEIIEVSEIESAYQAEVDHPIGNSQIYFVLHRHG